MSANNDASLSNNASFRQTGLGVIALTLLLLAIALQAKADSISFTDQPAGPSTFAYSSGPETITEGIVTLSGGVILTDETYADQNINVYATCASSTCGISYSFANPITITFAQPVSDLTIVIANNLPDTFTLADNNGNSVSAALPYLANTALTLNDSDITTATIGAADDSWDFALQGDDSLTFIPDSPSDLTPTPEPATKLLLFAGLPGLAMLARNYGLRSNMNPTARKESLLVQQIEQEIVILDQTSNRAHRLNATAAFIWRNCDGTHSVSSLSRLLQEELGIEDPSEEVTRLALEDLQKVQLIESGQEDPAHKEITRRELGVRLAVAATALPLIVSITVPTPSQAASAEQGQHFCPPGTAPGSKVCPNA